MVRDRWISSQFITFNSVLHLSRAALQLLLLSEIKDYVPVCFPFLLSFVLLGICFIRQCTVTTGSCSSPALEVPRQLQHFCVFELRLFTLLGTASHRSPPSNGLQHSSYEVLLAVLLGSMLPFCGLLSSYSLRDFPIPLFLSLRSDFPFLGSVSSYISSLSSCLTKQPLICLSPNQLLYLGMCPKILSLRPTGP